MSFPDSRKDGPVVLALETSTTLLGVSLVYGQDVLSEITFNKPKAHSTMLLPLCAEALDRSDVPLHDISCVAVSEGPGSFTGLRIGAATAQGLAVSLGKPIVMVPSFEVVLYQARHFRHVVVASGRARAQAASAGYSRAKVEGNLGFSGLYGFQEIIEAKARDLDELLREVRNLRVAEVHVTGDAAMDLVALNVRQEGKGPKITPVESYSRLPRPGTLGLIGARMFADGIVKEPKEAFPRYFRKSQAEVRSEGKVRPR